MAKLTRQIDGTYLTEENKNVRDLDMAYSRGNPTDLENINYAKDKYGYVPPSTIAGSNVGLNKDGLTMAQANSPEYWTSGKYSGTPNLPSTLSLVPAGVPEPTEEADIFNLLTRDALLKFQGVNTADLEKKKRALQLTALDRQSEITPEDLRTFSPEQQAAIRSGNIKALQPEFDDVAYQLNKAQQATANFEAVYEKVMNISQDYAQKMVAPDSVIENYKKLIEADPSNINTYLAKVNDKTRDAILQSLDYSKLKAADDDSSKLLSPTEAAALNVPYGTTRGEAAKLGVIPKVGATGLDPATQNLVFKLSEKFDASPIVKQYNEVQNKRVSIEDIVDMGVSGPADLALVFEFMKSLDPTSVVRESEYDTAATSGNIFKGWAAKFNGYMNENGGFLPENVKQEFKKITEIKYNAIQSQYQNLYNETARKIDNVTGGIVDANDFLTNYSGVDFISGETEIKDFDYYKNLYPNAPDEEIQALIEKYSFNSVGGDTELATTIAAIPDGEKGGQCGRFVNNISGLGVGDSYKSKLDKMDPNIKWPQPGMVFVMPLTGEMAPYGHTGIIIGIDGDKAIVKDSNWGKDEKIKTHTIPISKMTGFRSLT